MVRGTSKTAIGDVVKIRLVSERNVMSERNVVSEKNVMSEKNVGLEETFATQERAVSWEGPLPAEKAMPEEKIAIEESAVCGRGAVTEKDDVLGPPLLRIGERDDARDHDNAQVHDITMSLRTVNNSGTEVDMVH